MERLTKRVIPTAIAVGAGILTLLGYLVPQPVLVAVRDELVHWAVIVSGFAFILGFLNLLGVHLQRVGDRKAGWPYSVVLVVSALVSLTLTGAGLISEPAQVYAQWWFDYVLFPLQATAAGLLAFVLAVAAFRLVRNRRNVETIFFLMGALIVLLGAGTMPGRWGEWLAAMRGWWMDVPALAGMRGLLIGVGLGTLVVGLRVIIGIDRPHSDV